MQKAKIWRMTNISHSYLFISWVTGNKQKQFRKSVSAETIYLSLLGSYQQPVRGIGAVADNGTFPKWSPNSHTKRTKDPTQVFLRREILRTHKSSHTPRIFWTSSCGSPLVEKMYCSWAMPLSSNCYQSQTLTSFTAKELVDTRLLECLSKLLECFRKKESKNLSKYLFIIRKWQNVKDQQTLEKIL